MTAQTATYGMDYLNHAQPKDVLKWIDHTSLSCFNSGKKLHMLRRFSGETLTIPCRQFAASVIGRFEDCLCGYEKSKSVFIEWTTNKFEQPILKLHRVNFCETDFYLPINPFHCMTMPDGSPRTSCTSKELEEWRKELEA